MLVAGADTRAAVGDIVLLSWGNGFFYRSSMIVDRASVSLLLCYVCMYPWSLRMAPLTGRGGGGCMFGLSLRSVFWMVVAAFVRKRKVNDEIILLYLFTSTSAVMFQTGFGIQGI